MPKRIYITDFWTGPPDVEQAAIGELGTVTVCGAHEESDLLPRIADADGLLVWHDIRIGAATLGRLPRCKVLVRIGVGFDNVDREAARRAGIVVCNVPDYGTEDVADHALALLLSLVRSLPQLGAEVRSVPIRWNARSPRRSMRLRGKTFGIIGLGRIGTATAMRAKAFGMQVIAFDPYIPDGRDKALGIVRVDTLGELVAQSDVISLHTPLTPETRGMIDAGVLASCRPGAILLNTARGPCCDTRALLAALESGRLSGIGLDVFPTEPPTDDPLLAAARDPQHVAHHRCVLTPHSAFYTEEGFEEMRRKAALEVRRVLEGRPPRNPVPLADAAERTS